MTEFLVIMGVFFIIALTWLVGFICGGAYEHDRAADHRRNER